MSDVIVRLTYEHYRVPTIIIPPWLQVKGKPADETLYHYRQGTDLWTPYPRGGKTICYIKLRDGRIVKGEARCSYSDSFSYKTGRDLARKRACEAI